MSLKKVEKKKIISSRLIKLDFFYSNLSIENIKIIGFLIIINLFTQISSDNSLRKIISEFSYITLKISGIGQKKIFSDEYTKNYPDEIYINGIKQTNITNEYQLNNINNTIKFVWYNKLGMLRVFFKECADITEIDLSNLDTSEISRMDNIFNGCLSLTSVILDNIDTTKIRHIESMFKNCINLEYINLEQFNNRQLNSVNNIFEGMPENMVVCTDNNQIIAELKKKNVVL